jgi:hypothetical protein
MQRAKQAAKSDSAMTPNSPDRRASFKRREARPHRRSFAAVGTESASSHALQKRGSIDPPSSPSALAMSRYFTCAALLSQNY